MSFDAMVQRLFSPKRGTPAAKRTLAVVQQTQQHLALLEPEFGLRARHSRGGAEASAVEALFESGAQLSELWVLNGWAKDGSGPGSPPSFDYELKEVMAAAQDAQLSLRNSLGDIKQYVASHASPAGLGQLLTNADPSPEEAVTRLVTLVDHILSARASSLHVRSNHGASHCVFVLVIGYCGFVSWFGRRGLVASRA